MRRALLTVHVQNPPAMSRIWKGPALQGPVVGGNLISFIFKDSHRWKNLHAMECGYSGKALTYEELQEAVGRWGAWLTRFRGDAPQPPVVGRFSVCSVEVAVVQLGTVAAGAVFTGLASAAGPREIAGQLENCGATLIASSVEFLPRLAEAMEKLGRQIPVVVLGDAEASYPSGLNVVGTYEAIVKNKSLMPAAPVELSGEEIALRIYTSGSTGLPKAVEHTHNSLCATLQSVLHPGFNQYQLRTSETCRARIFLARDFGLAFALLCALLPGLAVGACLVIKQMDEKTVTCDFDRFKISSAVVVPPNLPSLIQMGKERPDLLKSFRHIFVSGGAIPSTLSKAINEFMPGIFEQKCYGTSEAGIIALDPITGGKSEFTGQICPNVSIKVMPIDGSGELQPANQTGILFVKSDGTMKGYLNNPTATREVLDADGWYNTGDIGLVDEDGFIQVLDRVKELIKLDDGSSASPSELENTIMEVPGVHEVCVVGARRADTGMDAIYAFVAKKPNLKSDVTEDCIKNHVITQLNKQKGLKKVIFVEQLPHNQNGKLHRVLLRSNAAEIENSK